MTDRIAQMKSWLDGLGYSDYELLPASEDASFRRYFRLSQDDNSWIVMDAPPDKEPCDAYVKVANMLTGIHLSAPEIIHENHHNGFLIITDFGDTPYLKALTPENADDLYGDAQAALLRMQMRLDATGLPPYDETLLRGEMDLFKTWFLEKLLGIELNQNQQALWHMSVETLVQNALEQPRVFVHRDYHSRNLMKLERHNPGILDFQDAMYGPVTYDLVSLLRDCYIDWPESKVDQWAIAFHADAVQEYLQGVSLTRFKRWFDLMGVQRHLKAIGIFSRLKLRDGKGHFIPDIPRTLNYLENVTTDETCLNGLNTLIKDLTLGFRIKSLLS